jgi:putative thioredoxin
MKNIIEVTEINFETEVLAYSRSTPVVVDFWAEWCKPCKALNMILEKLIVEMMGKFRLARLNVEENPNLAIQFNVNSLPTVKAVSNGIVVSEIIGNQPEKRVREFLEKIELPNPANLVVEKGQSLLLVHKWKDAETLFRNVLANSPEIPAALLGLSMSLLAQGQAEEAEAILHNFPASREFNRAQMLLPLATILLEDLHLVGQIPSDLDLTFKKSIEFVHNGKMELAVEGLLDLLRAEKNYRNGLAKQIVLSLLELMGSENIETRTYRSELASILH